MKPSRGMGAIRPELKKRRDNTAFLEGGKRHARRDNTDFTEYAGGGRVYAKGGTAKADNSSLWSKVKAEAKSKFDVYPSAYANAWAAKEYKKRGGSWSGSDNRVKKRG